MNVSQSCKKKKKKKKNNYGLHERCLRIIYNDKLSTFKQLLEKYILYLGPKIWEI